MPMWAKREDFRGEEKESDRMDLSFWTRFLRRNFPAQHGVLGWVVGLGGISPGKTTPKIFSLHLFLWGLAGLCAHKAC